MTDEDRERIRAHVRELADRHSIEAPLTRDQLDKLRILLRPAPVPETRSAAA